MKAISPARAQDRPRRPPRAERGGRHRHAARPAGRDDLPGDRPGAAHHDGDAAVAQGRDLDLEGVRAGLRRQDGGRGGRPRDARADQPRRRSGRARTASSPGCSTGRRAATRCRCPRRGEAKRAILDTYTKEHSAEYQAQAWIDLARKLGRASIPSCATRPTSTAIVLATSHHTHYVIGSGANDPQKYDPTASRETLDHSIPYIFAVALQDGDVAPRRRRTRPSARSRPDTVELWHKVTTVEDPEWTRRYHSNDPAEKAFGGRVEITLAERRADRRRDRGRRRAPARRAAVRARGLRRASSARSPTACSTPAEIDRFLDARRAPAEAHRRRGRRAQRDRAGPARRPEGTVLMLHSTRHRRREARRLPRGARERRAAPDARRVQPAERAAHPGQGLRGRLHLGRRARARTSACPTSG